MLSRRLSYDFPMREYMDLFSAEVDKLGQREEAGESIESINLEVKKLSEELRYYHADILPEASRRQGVALRQDAVLAASTEINHEPSPQLSHVVEEPEEEEEESEPEEEEEEEWSDSESEAPRHYRCPLTDEQLEVLSADYDDTITPNMVDDVF